MNKKESQFQAELIIDLNLMFPECLILKNDTSYKQGIPDLVIFYKNKWAFLECKRNLDGKYQPNQEYYLDKLNKMSFAAVICPENKEIVLNELQRAFSIRGTARFS